MPLVRLFASVLRRADDGSYWLVTPAEQGRIEVEDVPFTAVEMRRSGDGREQAISFRTNLDDWVPLDPEHPLRTVPDAGGAEVPYLLVRDRLEARLARPGFFEPVGNGGAAGGAAGR